MKKLRAIHHQALSRERFRRHSHWERRAIEEGLDHSKLEMAGSVLGWLSYRYKLRRLQKQKTRLYRLYSKDIDKARRKKMSHDEIDDIIRNEKEECDVVDDEISQIQTDYLPSQADKLLLPAPKFDAKSGMWKQSKITDRYHLSPTAATDLRAAIRKEQKERSEHLRAWVTSLTGLAGALIGLVALLLKFEGRGSVSLPD
jgi:hypothetical protein